MFSSKQYEVINLRLEGITRHCDGVNNPKKRICQYSFRPVKLFYHEEFLSLCSAERAATNTVYVRALCYVTDMVFVPAMEECRHLLVV